MELAGYAASILIGLILGMLGGGGSILSIPILVYLFHIDVVMASAIHCLLSERQAWSVLFQNTSSTQ
jgi:uncharacterized membrane protein YfcA